MVYQFTSHGRLPENSACPIHPVFQLYGRVLKGEKLTRKEKDEIANNLYGIFGQGEATFKYMGFAAPFSQVLNRYLVNIQNCGWQEYYSPDKTSLRRAIGSYGIIEIIEA